MTLENNKIGAIEENISEENTEILDFRDTIPLLAKIISPSFSNKQKLFRIIVITLIFPIILTLIGYFVENNLILPAGGIGLLEDWNILAMFFVFPMSLYLLDKACESFSIYSKEISLSFSKVKSNVIERLNNVFNERDAKSIAAKIILLLLFFLWVLLNAYNRFYKSSEIYFDSFWTSGDFPVTFWITNIYTTIVWGILCPLIIYVLGKIIYAVHLINHELIYLKVLQYQIFSSENTAGFKSLSNLSLSLCYLTIPFQCQAIVYYFWIPAVNQPLIIGILMLGITSILVFSLPIYTTHNAMLNAKQRLLEPLSLHINSIYLNSISKLNVYDIRDQLSDTGTRIKQLKELYETIDSHTTWPFNIPVLSRFFSTVLLTITVVTLTELIKILLN